MRKLRFSTLKKIIPWSGNRLIWLLAVGYVVLTGGLLVFSAVSESSVGTVKENLSHYWRTSYDILVRPKGSRSAVEEKYNLVEANFLAQIRGASMFSNLKQFVQFLMWRLPLH